MVDWCKKYCGRQSGGAQVGVDEQSDQGDADYEAAGFGSDTENEDEKSTGSGSNTGAAFAVVHKPSQCRQATRGTVRVINAASAAALTVENLIAWSLAVATKSVEDPDVPDYLLMDALLITAGAVTVFETTVELWKFCNKHDNAHHVFPEWFRDVEHGHYKMAFAIYPAIISGSLVQFIDAIIRVLLEGAYPKVISQVAAGFALAAFVGTLIYGLHSNHHVLKHKRRAINQQSRSATIFYYSMLVISALSIGSDVPKLVDLSFASFIDGFNAFNSTSVIAASVAVSFGSLVPILTGIVLSQGNHQHAPFLMDLTTPVGALKGQGDMLEAVVSDIVDHFNHTGNEPLPLALQIPAMFILLLITAGFITQLVSPCCKESKVACHRPKRTGADAESRLSVSLSESQRRISAGGASRATTYGTQHLVVEESETLGSSGSNKDCGM
jgi:hypothetical protein